MNDARPLRMVYPAVVTSADLFMFAKQPALGRTKTRLAADIGQAAALAFYRETLDILVRRLADNPRWKAHVAVTPDEALDDLPSPHRASTQFRKAAVISANV